MFSVRSRLTTDRRVEHVWRTDTKGPRHGHHGVHETSPQGVGHERLPAAHGGQGRAGLRPTRSAEILDGHQRIPDQKGQKCEQS